MASKIDQSGRKPPMPKSRPKQRISRQRRKTMNATAEYNAVRDIYLEQNPHCSNPGCSFFATQVHHIVGGTAGRARSLRNPDTWLGVCSEHCHNEVASQPVMVQAALKALMITKTIDRLRK
jgi:hypothetical protein